MARRKPTVPLRVKLALKKLGADIRDARKRRKIPVKTMAARALLSVSTLTKIERGDPGTPIGFYAAVLFVLDLADRLGELAAAQNDDLGLALAEQELPKRIRWPSQGSSDDKVSEDS